MPGTLCVCHTALISSLAQPFEVSMRSSSCQRWWHQEGHTAVEPELKPKSIWPQSSSFFLCHWAYPNRTSRRIYQICGNSRQISSGVLLSIPFHIAESWMWTELSRETWSRGTCLETTAFCTNSTSQLKFEMSDYWNFAPKWHFASSANAILTELHGHYRGAQ